MKSIKNIFKSSFAKSVLMIAGGTAFAQLLNVLLSPVVTRIYSPQEYGILTVYTAILEILAVIGSLRYEWGIVIADDDIIAINVLALSIIVLINVTVFVTLILVFFMKDFLYLFSGEMLSEYWLLIPLGIFFTGIYNIFVQWAFRKKNFKSISKTKLSQCIVQNITKIGCGLYKLGPIGLILGNIFGQSAGITTLSMPLVKKEKEIIKKINKKDILWCAKRYIRFPQFSTSSRLLNTAGIQLPILLITSMYGSEVIGFYGLADAIVNLPVNLIGRSVGDVFYGEGASIGRIEPKRLKELSAKVLNQLLMIGILPLAILILLGPFLFVFVFGQEWYEAGVYARIISFFVFARLIFTPIGEVFTIFEKQKEELVLNSFRVALVLIVFEISKLASLNSYWTVGLYSVAMSIVYVVTFLWAQKIINDEVKKKECSEGYYEEL